MSAPPAKSGLAARLASALVGLPLLVGLVLWAPQPLFAAVVTVALLIGAREYARICAAQGTGVPLGLLAPLVLGLVAVVTLWPPAAGAGAAILVGLLTLALLLTPCVGIAAGWELSAILPRSAASLLGLGYVGLLGSSLVALRGIEHGPRLLIMLLAVVWGTDSGAYFGGRLLGRHKLAPRVSPAKTREGALAGLAVGVGAGLLAGWLLGLPATPALLALLSALLSVAGQLGDLVESALKRGAGVKDSGQLIPGHGGILDRLDSLLFAAPVMYIGWVTYTVFS